MANTKTMKNKTIRNRLKLSNGGSSKTQKAGGLSQKKLFVKSMLKETNIVKTLIDSLGIKLHNKSIGVKKVSTKKSNKKNKDNNASSKIGGGDTNPVNYSSKNSNNSGQYDNLDKNSQNIYNAVKKYAMGILNKCYRKMSSSERKQVIDSITGNTSSGSDTSNSTTSKKIDVKDYVKSYVNDVLLWGIKGDKQNSGTILLSSFKNCDTQNTYNKGYYSDGRSAANGQNEERMSLAKSLGEQYDLSGVTSVFNSLLSKERDIVRDSMQGTPDMLNHVIKSNNNNETKKQKREARYKYENIKLAAKCNYFLPTGVETKDIANALQNNIVTISSMDINCEGDPVRTGSVYHIIKRSGHKSVSTNLQESDFHIIQSKMREANCYAVKYDANMDESGTRKERHDKSKNSKEALDSLVNLLENKKLIKNNALGMLYFIRRLVAKSS